MNYPDQRTSWVESPMSVLRDIVHNCVVHPLMPFLPTRVGDRLHDLNGQWAYGSGPRRKRPGELEWYPMGSKPPEPGPYLVIDVEQKERNGMTVLYWSPDEGWTYREGSTITPDSYLLAWARLPEAP